MTVASDNGIERPHGWAVVTGASSGIGYQFAIALAARGHPVLAVGRRRDRLQGLADDITRAGGLAEHLAADLATAEGVAAVEQAAKARDIELLVNNAGFASYGRFAEIAPGSEQQLVRVNVEAVVTLTRRLLPAMLSRGRAGIINVASQMAVQPVPYFASYAASKAFVLSFSEALSEELRGTGVRVTAIAPGFVSTEFADVAGSHSPQSRLPTLTPERVVAAALRAHDRGRTFKVVGAFYGFLTVAVRFAPRGLLRRGMARVMRPPSGGPHAHPRPRSRGSR